MATFIIRAQYKKSTIEREHWHKDGSEVIRETGWRGGSFYITTEDDNPPDIDLENPDDFDVYENDYECELIECFDGCWEEITFSDDIAEEEQERLQELFDDEGFYEVMEGTESWSQGDTEMILQGPLQLETEDGTIIGQGEKDE